MDFAGRDGWRMYHGDVVPGFPQHPHRGFETVTYVRKGLIDHSDSLGATARFGRGDVQWLTAAGGIVHSEMFPLVERDRAQPARAVPDLAQPARRPQDGRPVLHDALGRRHPHGRDRRRRRAPHGAHGDRRRGRGRDVTPPQPPPSSWASAPESDLAIWHLAFEPGSSWTLPPAAGPDTIRMLYVFDGDVAAGRRPMRGHELGKDTGAVLRCDEPVAVASSERAPSAWCCRAGRSASRSPSRARS